MKRISTWTCMYWCWRRCTSRVLCGGVGHTLQLQWSHIAVWIGECSQSSPGMHCDRCTICVVLVVLMVRHVAHHLSDMCSECHPLESIVISIAMSFTVLPTPCMGNNGSRMRVILHGLWFDPPLMIDLSWLHLFGPYHHDCRYHYQYRGY